VNRLHIPAEQIESGTTTIRGERLTYLRDVLRLRPGSPVEVFDGVGHVYAAVVESFADDAARLTLGAREDRPFGGVRVTLLQGLPKADKLELIIQKAVELGVSRIVPVQMHRCIVKLDERKAADRVERWQKIADEAARQSGRAEVAVIAPVVSLDSVLRSPPAADERRFVLDEEERNTRLRDVLDGGGAFTFLIGPEGGIAREEVAAAQRAGFRTVTLGPRVLRTETVALATLSIVQHVLGDLG
jgi:16S rRNA (uracil1498-N3)-methyltransferase